MKSIFEERYRRDPVYRDGAAQWRDFKAAGEKYLKAMKEIPGRPRAMEHFDSVVTGDSRRAELESFRKNGGKVIGLFCNFVPEELVYAAGAVPVRLCTEASPAVPVAEEIIARDICPLVKSAFGMKMMKLGYFDLCDLVIIPTSCDAKKKCSKFFSSYMETWTLDLPQAKDYEKNLGLWTREIRGLKDRLENFCGRRITKGALEESIRALHRRTEAFRRIHELRKARPYALCGRDFFMAVQASFYDDCKRWTEKALELASELEAAVRPDPAPAPLKLMLTGAPVIWPNYKLLHTIESAGAVVVTDTLCSGTQRLFDPVEVDEWTYDGMLRAVAVKHLFPSICPCFIENAEHIDRILELAADFKVEGVVYHTLRLCQLFDMEFNHVAAVLKEKNIPLLNITTDLGTEDEEQIKTRVEAFLEIVGTRI